MTDPTEPRRAAGAAGHHRKPTLGLTGYPGSGKSTAAAHLALRGGAVIDADALARAAFDDPEVLAALRDAFGPDAFHPDGTPDRAALAQRVFSDPDAKRRIEAIVHPYVAKGRLALHEQYADDPAVRFIVEDCPLLIEAGLHRDCDVVLFLDTPRDFRLQRLAQTRGWDATELDRRESSQADPATRRAHAHHVLTNDGPPDDLAGQLDGLLRQWGWLASTGPAWPHSLTDPKHNPTIPEPGPPQAPPAGV